MRRTQLYLEDNVWDALKIQSKTTGLSISELVRRAVREKYLGNLEKRKKAMLAIEGIWKDRDDLPGTETYIRSLRRDPRHRRFRR